MSVLLSQLVSAAPRLPKINWLEYTISLWGKIMSCIISSLSVEELCRFNFKITLMMPTRVILDLRGRQS